MVFKKYGGGDMVFREKKFLRGAASFYIVAFSTLILVIIAASFATVIISEVTRASNDDLSQSAYDAALTGVEDAKMAYSNYLRCLKKNNATPVDPMTDGNSEITCGNIIWWMENLDKSGCDMVALILGRISKAEWVGNNGVGGEVLVSDTTSTDGIDGVTSNLNQAYTCAMIRTVLPDVRASLNSTTQTKVIKVELANSSGYKVSAESVKKIKFSWYELKKDEKLNWKNTVDGRVAFQPVFQSEIATPPTISLQLVQTGESFNIEDFEKVGLNQTDRATMFFVPTGNLKMASNKSALTTIRNGKTTKETYIGIGNYLSAEQVVWTNDHSKQNLPFLTYCPDDENQGEFYCSVTIELPNPIGNGSRNDDTFMFLASLPYGEPDTNFAIEFLDENDQTIYTRGVQIEVDSTGRANDLYRRVETRLEPGDSSFYFSDFAVQLLSNGGNNDEALKKNITVTVNNGN